MGGIILLHSTMLKYKFTKWFAETFTKILILDIYDEPIVRCRNLWLEVGQKYFCSMQHLF